MIANDQALPLALFDYALPDSAIAHHPVEPRDASRLMVLAGNAAPAHHHFSDLPELLAPGDLLLLNRTKVLPARLRAVKASQGRVELLLHTPIDGEVSRARRWLALARPAKGLRPGMALTLVGGPSSSEHAPEQLVVGERHPDGSVEVLGEEPLLAVMERRGEMPLPPYITRATPDARDRARYQTLMAREPGAVAAPTASLHFTERTFADLQARGIETAEVVLHVGPGTFLPVRPEHAEDVRGHAMHKESYVVPPEAQRAIARAQGAQRRIVAAGTTALRAVETWADSGLAEGHSELFIYPGYKLRVARGLVTNFHLPKSTLIMLVSALCGRERLLGAYGEALAHGYRFFSYGDAMLVLR